jgi:hypothetical protein
LIGELFKLETGVQATHVPYVQFPRPSPTSSVA